MSCSRGTPIVAGAALLAVLVHGPSAGAGTIDVLAARPGEAVTGDEAGDAGQLLARDDRDRVYQASRSARGLVISVRPGDPGQEVFLLRPDWPWPDRPSRLAVRRDGDRLLLELGDDAGLRTLRYALREEPGGAIAGASRLEEAAHENPTATEPAATDGPKPATEPAATGGAAAAAPAPTPPLRAGALLALARAGDESVRAPLPPLPRTYTLLALPAATSPVTHGTGSTSTTAPAAATVSLGAVTTSYLAPTWAESRAPVLGGGLVPFIPGLRGGDVGLAWSPPSARDRPFTGDGRDAGGRTSTRRRWNDDTTGSVGGGGANDRRAAERALAGGERDGRPDQLPPGARESFGSSLAVLGGLLRSVPWYGYVLGAGLCLAAALFGLASARREARRRYAEAHGHHHPPPYGQGHPVHPRQR